MFCYCSFLPSVCKVHCKLPLKKKVHLTIFFKKYILIRATHIINVGHDNTEQVHSFAVCYAM